MNKLKVLYEDNHIIVVEKPIGILSQQDHTNDPDMITIIKTYLKEKYKKPGNVYLGLVHRLDRMTSGIMVFAKTSKAASRLSKAFKENNFIKNYIAVVHGKLEERGEMVDYLQKRESDHTSIVTDKNKGKLAKLHYEVLSYSKEEDLSLVEIKLETGRHHQIRVQFASRNHPLYSDHRYGYKEEGPIALCAYHLEFIHPVTNIKLKFTMFHPDVKIFYLFDHPLLSK